MDEKTKEALIDAGVDLTTALHRFLEMEPMYVSFLKRYVEDESVAQIGSGIENRDAEMAFKAAHSLKGLAGNLGIDKVYNLAGQITEIFRDGTASESDISQASELYEALKKEDSMISELISQIP